MSVIARLQVLDSPVQDLILSSADSPERRPHLYVRHQAHALQLAAVRVANSLAGEVDPNTARHAERGYIAIGASGGGTNKLGPVRSFEKKTGVLPMAYGSFVDNYKHDGLAPVPPFIRMGNSLEKRWCGRQAGYITSPTVRSHCHAPMDHGGHYEVLVGQPGGNGPSGAIWVGAIIKDNRFGVFELLEHGVDHVYSKPIKVRIADVARQQLHGISCPLGFLHRCFLSGQPDLLHLIVPIANGHDGLGVFCTG